MDNITIFSQFMGGYASSMLQLTQAEAAGLLCLSLHLPIIFIFKPEVLRPK